MAKPIVVLVHGMGTHPAAENQIKTDFIEGTKEAAGFYGITDFNIEDYANLQQFNYSDELDERRNIIAGNQQAILGQFADLPGSDSLVGLVHKLIAYQANFNKDDFIYTHWLDVALYCSEFGEHLRVKFAEKLNEWLLNAQGARVHVIAHSLGTALANDTLEKFYKVGPHSVPADTPYLKAGAHNIKTLWTFANVSRLTRVLFPIDIGGHSTVVKAGPAGCADMLFNCFNVLDPFTWFKRYQPVPVPGATATFKNEVIRVKNTHSFREYVTDPEVASTLLNELTGLGVFADPEKIADAVGAHRDNSINEKVDDILVATRALRNGHINTLPELLKAIKAFRNTLDALV